MSRNRNESGQYTDEVTLDDVLGVFDEVEGPVVTTGDVAEITGCSDDTARRKLSTLRERGLLARRKAAGRMLYWLLKPAAPDTVNPDDPIFTDRPCFSSGQENLSGRVDELLYGEEA